jgi:hypothetical protein
MEVGGYRQGLLVQSCESRPIKIEGNPEHPTSLGATGPYEQAALLDLYNPSRLQSVLRAGQSSSWLAFAAEFGLLPSSGWATGRGPQPDSAPQVTGDDALEQLPVA